MTRIVQMAPFMVAGAGVPGVAWNLDRELRKLDADVDVFTFGTARNGKRDPIRVRGRISARLVSSWRTVWLSTVGTRRAREYLARNPEAVAIVHGDFLTGDIYVSHGVLFAAMRAQGSSGWRYLRDPANLYAHVRDRRRFRSRTHRRIVALTKAEVQTLVDSYGHVDPPVVVISNGVDLDAYRPPTRDERRTARDRFQLDEDDRAVVFVGHEFERKGLPIAIESLIHAPTVLLLVIGGIRRMVDEARAYAERLGVAERVLFLGEQQQGIHAFLAAADMLVLPSVYESSGLVILEALASGLPVVSTRVGVAPDVVVDGVNGYLVERVPAEIGDRLERIAAEPLGGFTNAARASVEGYSWSAIARQYLDLAEAVAAEKAAETLPRTAR
jgi:UDP-glucose:(heptosyl)LPS alpha-1,3-glucosyltransferase